MEEDWIFSSCEVINTLAPHHNRTVPSFLESDAGIVNVEIVTCAQQEAYIFNYSAQFLFPMASLPPALICIVMRYKTRSDLMFVLATYGFINETLNPNACNTLSL
jgi:hypothetical protein